MPKQTINFGEASTGFGGDTRKSALVKCNENFTELYDRNESQRIQTTTDCNTLVKQGTYLAMFTINTGTNTPRDLTHYGLLRVTRQGTWVMQEFFNDSIPIRCRVRFSVNTGATWTGWDATMDGTNVVKADGAVRTVESASASGPEFNEKTGVYRLLHIGASEAIAHFNCAGSSASSFQFKVNYANQGISYRSSRDSAGFEKPWERLITEVGGTVNYINSRQTITIDGVDTLNGFKKLIQASSSTDGGYLAVGNNGSDKGYVELGTVDDGDTAIYVRKRNNPNTILTTATLLDPVNNTQFPGKVSSKGLYLNKISNVGAAISWYSPDFNAWQDYMANAGSTTNGVNLNITAPSGALVNSWARRSVIENMGGYGWTFESMASQGTKPNILMELSSSSGQLRVTGAIHGNNGVHTTKFHSHVPYSFYTTSEAAQRIHCGGLLASNAYADATHVPNNGIYSKGDILVGTGVIGAPTSKYHNIDLGGDGKDRMIFSSYGGNFRFMNTSSTQPVMQIDINGVHATNFYGAATSVRPQRISAGSNLNSFTSPGEYYNDSNAEVGGMANSPTGWAFALTVQRTAGVIQTLTTYSGGGCRRFIRGFYDGGWSAWREQAYL